MTEAIERAHAAAESLGGREGAIVRTKLEEAGLWVGACRCTAGFQHIDKLITDARVLDALEEDPRESPALESEAGDTTASG